MHQKFSRTIQLLSALYITWAFTPLLTRSIPNYVVIAVVAAWLVCVGLSFRDILSARPPRLLLLVASFVLLAILSYLRTTGVQPGNLALRVAYFFPVCILLYFHHSHQINELRRLAAFSIAVASLTALTNIDLLRADPLASKYLTGSVDSVVDRYSSTNLASVSWVMTSVVLLPVLLGIAQIARSAVAKVLFLGLAMLHAVFVAYAGSSTSTIAMLLILLLSLLLLGSRFPLLGLGIVVLGAVGLVTLGSVPSDIPLAPDSIELYASRLNEIADALASDGPNDGSLSARMVGLAISFNSFLSNPIAGVGMVYGLNPAVTGIGMHSQLVDDLARYGLVGAALLVPIYYEVARFTLSSARRLRSYLLLAFGAALFLSILNPTSSPSFGVVLFLIIPTLGQSCSMLGGLEIEEGSVRFQRHDSPRGGQVVAYTRFS